MRIERIIVGFVCVAVALFWFSFSGPVFGYGGIGSCVVALVLFATSGSPKEEQHIIIQHPTQQPSTTAPQRVVETREKIIERILVICPYCSHKNEQGVTTCGGCGADV